MKSIPADLISSNDEAEQEKVINLWEKTKPFFECKESLKKYISKRLEIQVHSHYKLLFDKYCIKILSVALCGYATCKAVAKPARYLVMQMQI